jgi:spermidine/putrescine transport system substrate-binding protein
MEGEMASECKPCRAVRDAFNRRSVLLAGAASAFVGSLGLGSRRAAAADELNCLVWCDHTDPALLEPFEQAFNCKINVKEYAGTGEAIALLEQSQPGDWDVFVVDSVDIPNVVAKGLLAELPEAELPWGDIFPELHQKQLHYKDGKAYAVPEKFGYNALAFNRDKVPEEEARKAAVMWDPKYSGRIAIYDYYIPTMEMVALGIGIRPDTITKDNLPQIRDKLLEMKKLASVVGDVPTTQNALITGSADLIVAGGEYTVVNLMKENPALDWVLPAEGGIRWMQAIGVFATSAKQKLATEFVKYILSPDGQARLATSSCYWAMPTNSKASLPDDIKKVLRWDEQPGFIKASHPYFIPDAELDAAMQEVWTQFLQA